MVMEAAHRYQDKGPTSQDEHKTIFDGLINKFVQESGDGTLHLDRLPVRLLSDQAFMLLLAGTETTATTMVFLLHLLSENHHEESRLLHDLKKLGDMLSSRFHQHEKFKARVYICGNEEVTTEFRNLDEVRHWVMEGRLGIRVERLQLTV